MVEVRPPIPDASVVPPLDPRLVHPTDQAAAGVGTWSVSIPDWTWQVSPEVYHLMGYTPQEQPDAGRMLMEAIHPSDQAWVAAEIETDIIKRRTFTRSFRIIRRDGDLREVRVAGQVTGAPDGSATTVVGVIQDITEEVMTSKAWLTTLLGNAALVRATDEYGLLTSMCEALVVEGGYRLAWYGRYDETRDPPLACLARAGFDHGYIDDEVVGREDSITRVDPSTLAIVTGEPFIVNDMRTDERFAPWREPATGRGHRALAVLPVRTNHSIDGALLVYSAFEGAFHGAIHPLLTSLAENIGYGLSRLRDRDRLARTLISTVDFLGSVLETRDPYTAGHQHRVASLAKAVGARMGLHDEILQGLSLGAGVHDLGKLAVPAELLSKPGTLLPQELDLIRTHASRGYELARRFEWPWPIADMLHQHHERFNGSGYPQGLVGEQILLEARILAVCDTYEAISHHRPYRPALGKRRAVAIVDEGSGQLFDPDVVKAFHGVMREGFTFDMDPWTVVVADGSRHQPPGSAPVRGQ